MSRLFALLKETYQEWRDDEAPTLAASLSYYTLFSLAPLALIALGVAGIFFGQEGAREGLMAQVRSLVGPEGAAALAQMLDDTQRNRQGPVAAVTGLVLLLVGASGVFGQLQGALNRVWEVEPDPERGLWATVRARILAVAMVLGTGFLLMASLVLSAAVASLSSWVTDLAPWTPFFAHLGEWVANIALFTVIFGAIFKVLPDVDLRWRDVRVGALATALLFSVGKVALGLYLARSATGSTFGAAGSLVVLLVWVYYSSMLLLFGAEFTQVWARRQGARLEPTRGAVRVVRSRQVVDRAGRGSGGVGATAGETDEENGRLPL